MKIDWGREINREDWRVCSRDGAVRKSLSEEVTVEGSPDQRKEGATQIPREELTAGSGRDQ